ncbi:apolipoprotein N-acyltransferase [Nocardioides ferulae]|uniref:apolipoprotein N-acyltransferase n=1 Tax=Nocardioides ferulae TaxID=2340821 RepID=UPI000EB240EA|nr:apolipoprotein N-acyltransferase [Nocardioides ferulae]
MLTRTLLAALAGLALALAFEPVAAAFLIPVAVAGFVLTTRGLRARSGWVPGLAFGVVFLFTHLWWLRAVGTDAWLALTAAESLFFALLGSVTAVLQQRRWWPLWVSAAWVAVEVWRSGWPFGGLPWGRLAYGVADTPVAEALPYAGMSGVSLLLALTGALLAWLATARDRRQWFAAGGALAAVLAIGALPALAPYQPDSEGEVTVAAVQGDVPGNGDDILADHRQVTANHIEATVDLAERVGVPGGGETADAGRTDLPRPDFVLWPENSTAVDPFRDTATNSGIESAVTAIGVPVLVGAIVDAGEDHVLNQGIVWDPVTGAGDRYTKRHPVAFGEYIPFRSLFEGSIGRLDQIPRDMLSGTREEPLQVAGVPVANAICFDIAYDDGIHDQVSRGAELLTVQTSNATFIHTDQIDQQFAITRLRALETGRWVVVAATNGVSGVISPDGEVVSSAAPRTREVLLERVPLVDAVTPAVRLGPWTGRACVVLTAVGLLMGLVPYRRSRRQQGAGEDAAPGRSPALTVPATETSE